MTAEVTFAAVLERAVQTFGGLLPSTRLEGSLRRQFEAHPATVQASVEKIASRFAAGRVHSPWAVLERELSEVEKREALSVDIGPDREREVHLVERWLAHVGALIPSEAEVVDAVFGPYGRLRAWAGDEQLEARIIARWRVCLGDR